jgi:hypothetical protein
MPAESFLEGEMFQCDECSYISDKKIKLSIHKGRVHKKLGSPAERRDEVGVTI